MNEAQGEPVAQCSYQSSGARGQGLAAPEAYPVSPAYVATLNALGALPCAGQHAEQRQIARRSPPGTRVSA